MNQAFITRKKALEVERYTEKRLQASAAISNGYHRISACAEYLSISVHALELLVAQYEHKIGRGVENVVVFESGAHAVRMTLSDQQVAYLAKHAPAPDGALPVWKVAEDIGVRSVVLRQLVAKRKSVGPILFYTIPGYKQVFERITKMQAFICKMHIRFHEDGTPYWRDIPNKK